MTGSESLEIRVQGFKVEGSRLGSMAAKKQTLLNASGGLISSFFLGQPHFEIPL